MAMTHQQALQTVLLLRRHVIRWLTADPCALVSLALACAPLADLCALHGRPLGPRGNTRQLNPPPAHRFSLAVCDATVAAAVAGDEVQLRALLAPPLASIHEQVQPPLLVRRVCATLGVVMRGGAQPLGEAEARAQAALLLLDACQVGSCAVLRFLCAPPYSLWAEGVKQDDYSVALLCACARGHVEVVRMLAREAPFEKYLHDALGKNRRQLLHVACTSCEPALLRLLTRPPFCLSRDDALWDTMLNCGALVQAAWGPCGDSVRLLAQPPFCLGRSDMLEHDMRAITVCQANTGVIHALMEAPYYMNEQDVRQSGLFNLACSNSSVCTLRLFARPPFSFGKADVPRMSLYCAVCHNSLEALCLLSELPYCQGHDEAASSECLENACAEGSVEIIRALGRPPFSLGKEVACAVKALAYACEGGSLAAVEELAAPPFSQGHKEASEQNCLLGACKADQMVRCSPRPDKDCGVVIIGRLAQPPYSLGKEDAQAAWDHPEAPNYICSDEVLAALAAPPYHLVPAVRRVAARKGVQKRKAAAARNRRRKNP
eukprot:TRINITY_DN19_c0_g2_i1.p1 TRINITY_DN19_c0_g2~~TRINITY_DN19_c0_g2_i1.p1  ORF type:complete len:558 (+),score=149.91 TRINITY_DN19_c0_g2_i1:35-1675(+)